METAIIIFFISVGLVVIVPILLLIIQGIRNYFRKRKRQKSVYQKTDDKSEKSLRTESIHQDGSRADVRTVSETAGYGEAQIYECLKDYEKQGCRFLFNVYIPKNDGETTEIDALMISPKGIFVFESKNISGYITGGENDQYWIQKKTDEYGDGVSNKFYNPIMQNNTHVRSLKEVLDYECTVYSIVVFSDECILKDDIDSISGDTQVVTLSSLKETVEAFNKFMSSDMSDFDIETVYNLLYPYTQVSESVKNEHIKNIQNKYQSENNIYQ